MIGLSVRVSVDVCNYSGTSKIAHKYLTICIIAPFVRPYFRSTLQIRMLELYFPQTEHFS